jgi:hypothetical protein
VILLPKTLSTHHIPQQARSKYSKRAFANYDKENAVRMFGYRAVFTKGKMAIKVPDPRACQKHKPLERFVHDIVNDLNSGYLPVQKYSTRRKVLIVSNEDDEPEKDEQVAQTHDITEDEGDEETAAHKTKNGTFKS